MRTTLTARETGRNRTYQTTCHGTLSDTMFCPTPPIVLNDVLETRQRRRAIPIDFSPESQIHFRSRRQSAGTINEEYNIDVEIGFVLDGVEEYRNLSTTLPQYSSLNIHADPAFGHFDPPSFSRTFTSTWPVSEKLLEIKGERLLDGIQENGYTIMIGVAICQNTDVQSNLIVCEPPKKRPQVAPEDDAGHNNIPVKVLYADRVAELGHLNYVQNLWEYPPGRYGIIGALCGLALIIGLIVFCICYKRRQRSNSYKEVNQFQNVNRWTTHNSVGSNSFIPGGPRLTSNYTRSDPNLSLYGSKADFFPGRYSTHYGEPPPDYS